VITEFDKLIYNTYLKASRQSNNSPYKFRKNFDRIDEQTFICLKKLSSFFKRFPNIKMEDFFNAPFRLYKDETYFPLDFFISLKATKAYTLIQKQVNMLDPDVDEQLKFIKESLVFIFNFCKSKNISFSSYLFHKTKNENSFVLHLKERKVSIYSLFGFNNFEKIFKSKDSEVLKFILGDEFYNNFSVFKTKLLNSKKAFNLVTQGNERLAKKTVDC